MSTGSLEYALGLAELQRAVRLPSVARDLQPIREHPHDGVGVSGQLHHALERHVVDAVALAVVARVVVAVELRHHVPARLQ